jgi:Mrp family chromosome partitioning ATPase
MPDIDDALARAYGMSSASSSPRKAATGTPPGPHFSLDAPPARPFEAPGREAVGSLAWPEVVRALERAHGDRFEGLADAVLDAAEERGLRALLFTSPHRAEGRTTLVLGLARSLARRPGRTLLVEGDLGGPMLARALGLRPEVGIDDVIERGAALSDALIVAPDDHLTVLPARAAATRPREAIASPEWSRLMARLRREFDLVLVDGGPLFPGLNATMLPAAVDAAVLVHHKVRTDRRSLQRARQALDSAGIELLGLAETFCSA